MQKVILFVISGISYLMYFDFIGDGAAVLIRSLEPSEGEDLMRKARSVKKSDKSKELKHEKLCNGPSKLTQVRCYVSLIRFQDFKVLVLHTLSIYLHNWNMSVFKCTPHLSNHDTHLHLFSTTTYTVHFIHKPWPTKNFWLMSNFRRSCMCCPCRDRLLS